MSDSWPEDVAELPADEAAQPAESEAAIPPLEAPPLEVPEPLLRTPDEHAGGGLEVPDGFAVLEGTPEGARRGVAVVVSRFNGEIGTALLASALEELERAGVLREAITSCPSPAPSSCRWRRWRSRRRAATPVSSRSAA